WWSVPIILGMAALSWAAAHICSAQFQLSAAPPPGPDQAPPTPPPAEPLNTPNAPPATAPVKPQNPIALTPPFLALSFLIWFGVWQWLPITSSIQAEGLRIFFLYRSQYPLSGASPVFP